jgi:non-specific serine/threonine protein kinase
MYTTENSHSFGYWIRRRRKALDLTQAKLADLVACTLSTIKKIELDERRPSGLMAERLADSLQIPPTEREVFMKVARQVYSPVRLDLPLGPEPGISPAEKKSNLPLPATRLIGRAGQIRQITQLLQQPDVRMLTFTGPGGVGKTRLASHIASEVLNEFPDGCWLVELAPLSNPSLLAQQIITALGIPAGSGKSPVVTLVGHLRNRRILLLLDNCEHLIDACSNLAHVLLSSCEGLVILSTSRESLNIPEEFIWSVPPLDVPEVEARFDLEIASQVASIRMFMERAGHVSPNFKLTEQNYLTIAKICRRLDGLPLAIELAAARIRTLSPDQIYARLDHAVQFLDGGFRTASSRQQTMRGAIEWSFDLLSLPERVLLRRLSVFAGSWTLSAAESICSQPAVVENEEAGKGLTSLENDDILNLLIKLVNKSIVVPIDRRGHEQRFALLETIWQFAGEKLEEAGEVNQLRQKHLDYYMNWVEQVSPDLRGEQQLLWQKTLDLELENLRLALTYGLDFDPVSGLRLCSALGRYWRIRNLVVEGETWLTKLLDAPQNQAPMVHRARALGILSSLGIFSAPAPEIWAKESLAISESLHEESTRAYALWVLGTTEYLRYGQLDQGRMDLEASYEAYHSIGDGWGMAQVLFQLANLVIAQGDAVRQRHYLEHSLALYRDCGDVRGAAGALDNLASVLMDTEADLTTARAMVEEALDAYHRLEASESKHNALFVYSTILAWQGEYLHAREVLLERLEIIRQSRIPINIALAEVLIAGVDRLSGMEAQAGKSLEENLRALNAIDRQNVPDWYLSTAWVELAYIVARKGDTERARDLVQQAFEVSSTFGQTSLFYCRGTIELSEKNGRQALDDFLQSLRLCMSTGNRLIAILATEGIASALCLLSKPEMAARLLSASSTIRSRIGAPVSPWDQPAYVRLKDSLKHELGTDGFADAWKHGQALEFDQAVEQALELKAGS